MRWRAVLVAALVAALGVSVARAEMGVNVTDPKAEGPGAGEDPVAYPNLPPDTECEVTTWCGSGGQYCSSVCAKGTVVTSEWFENALQTQLALAREQPFCHQNFLGTHNSAIELSSGYGGADQAFDDAMEKMREQTGNEDIRWQTSDHYVSMRDQLRMGQRIIEVDVHWVKKELTIGHCGGVSNDEVDEGLYELNEKLEPFGRQIYWDTGTIGCWPSFSMILADDQRSFESAMQEIEQWYTDDLNAAQQEEEFTIIMIDTEPDNGDWDTVDQMIAVFDDTLGRDAIYTPQDYTADGNAFPTAAEMAARGKHWLIACRVDFGGDMSDVMFLRDDVCDWSEPDLGNFLPYPSCCFADSDGTCTQKTNQGQFLRTVTSEIQYAMLNAGGNLGNDYPCLDEEHIPEAVACNVNLLAGDNLDTPRAEAGIWTWAADQPDLSTPADGSQCATLSAADGRWYAKSCVSDTADAVVCVDQARDDFLYEPTAWSVIPAAGTSFGDASTACADAGLTFRTPSNPLVNRVLQDAVPTDSFAWLNYSH